MDKFTMRKISYSLKNEKAIFFLGAGFSKPFGMCSWSEFLSKLYLEMNVDFESELKNEIEDKYEFEKKDGFYNVEYLKIATQDNLRDAETLKYCLDLKDENIFYNILKKEFECNDQDFNRTIKNKNYELFKNYCSSYLITTNYDNVLEKLFPDWDVLSYKSGKETKSKPNKNKILKIHGTYDDNESIVLTEKNYIEFLENDNYYKNKLQVLFSEKDVIMFGYSLQDNNIMSIITTIKDRYTSDVKTNNIYIVTTKYDREPNLQNYKSTKAEETIKIQTMGKYLFLRKYYESMDIQIIEVEDFDDLICSLEQEQISLEKENSYFEYDEMVQLITFLNGVSDELTIDIYIKIFEGLEITSNFLKDILYLNNTVYLDDELLPDPEPLEGFDFENHKYFNFLNRVCNYSTNEELDESIIVYLQSCIENLMNERKSFIRIPPFSDLLFNKLKNKLYFDVYNIDMINKLILFSHPEYNSKGMFCFKTRRQLIDFFSDKNIIQKYIDEALHHDKWIYYAYLLDSMLPTGSLNDIYEELKSKLDKYKENIV